MANTVITSTANSIKAVFNADPNKPPLITKGTWQKSYIEQVLLKNDHIEVVERICWMITDVANTIGALRIDSVDGVAPTSLSDLYDKISTLVET